MTDCTFSKIDFPRCCGRRVEADFTGGDITSNGGAALLAAADRRLGLLSGLARRLDDGRQAGKVAHRPLPLLRQRAYAVALGYEDVNDHAGLRDDLALQTAVGRDRRLASPSAASTGRLTAPGRGRHMSRWWRASSPRSIRRHRSWCSTSTRPTMPCTAVRWGVSSTAITITIASCRSTCSAVSISW